jgi:hypothetical protein
MGDEGAVALAASLEKSRTLQWLSLRGNLVGVPGAKALAAAVVKSRAVTEIYFNENLVSGEILKEVNDAALRGVQYRRVLAFTSAVVTGRERKRTCTENFVWKDGDHAMGDRVTRFLGGGR